MQITATFRYHNHVGLLIRVMYTWICPLWQTFSLLSGFTRLRYLYTLHWSCYGHVFTTALLFCWNVLIQNMTLCLPSSPAASVLRWYLIISSQSISLSDSQLWLLFDEAFTASGLQCTEFILYLPSFINSRHYYAEHQWCWTFQFRLSELKLAQ